MSEVIENNLVGDNQPEYSVSEISGVVKGLIESEFEYVRIRGEIGRVSNPDLVISIWILRMKGQF
ncbi:MAG: hypothetical protein CM15mP54_10890 [Paracoccaceae bacterium]|nr:MAG: hypothetical protein CM15mP54_10890 [Paracoccaceae bacterium]